MSHDELSQIITRLDRLEDKVDALAGAFHIHEGGACQREKQAEDIRKAFLGMFTGIAVAVLAAAGSFVLTVYNHIGGTK